MWGPSGRWTSSHLGYDGQVHTGRLIVAAEVAEDMVDIMSQRSRPVPDRAHGDRRCLRRDDDLSMAANNTSAFNCRPVTGGSVVGALLRDRNRREPPGQPICDRRDRAALLRRPSPIAASRHPA